MAGPAIDHDYSYAFPSAVRTDPEGVRLDLATSGGGAVPEAHPYFFRGRLLAVRETADLLLALSRVVASRFYTPPAMLARILREADPVVTCGEDRLRFEGFSACCGVYARVDLLPDAVDGAWIAKGTTNVDFNPSFRTALTRLDGAAPSHLSIGAGAVELETGAHAVIERKVPLPVRWLKGFVEVQAHQARMATGKAAPLEVGGAEAQRFLRSLPRQGMHGRPAWVAAAGRGLRLSQVESRAAVRVGGIERLRVLEDLARHAIRLRVFQSPGEGASGWELTTRTARFHLVLSPDVFRGFSGEGQVLSELADAAGERALGRVRAALHWQTHLAPGALAAETGLPRPEIASALARLGASGLVGYDLSAGAYFHRVLPFDLTQLEALHPRLRDARKLCAEKAVIVERRDGDAIEAWVRSADVEHRVQITESGARCTCPWYGKHQGDRGPCKHVLAVQLELEDR